MSHSTCLVIGNDPEKQLEPFAEQWESDTPPYFAEFEEADLTKLKEKFDARPPEEQRRYPTFKSWCEDAYGYSLHDGNYGYWTNPNAKWDWYLLGGRWSGFFKMKNGTSGSLGEPGAFDNKAPDGYADQILKKDIDIEGMRMQAKGKAWSTYEQYERATAGKPMAQTWEEVRKQASDVDGARDFYNNQPWIKALKKADLLPWMDDAHELFCVGTGGKEQFIQQAIDRTLSTFAILNEGKWYEKGEMGWWGMSSDEMPESEWLKKSAEMFDALPDDTLLSVYDLHI